MTTIPFRDLPDAGLWRRLAAAAYDGLLLMALWFIATGVVVIAHRGEAIPAAWMQWLGLPLLWLLTALFYAWFWQHGGQTLGMKTWHLRLVTADDRPLSWSDCFARCAAGTFSWLPFGLGYLWVLWRGRSWHDLATRTRVVVLPKDAV